MSNSLTKADLVHCLSLKIGLNKREAKDLINQFFEEIIVALENGREVILSNFGKFLLRDKRKRIGRNPKTKKVFPILSRRVVTFSACQKFRQIIESNTDAKEK